MFIHFPQCLVWCEEEGGPCTCPREWLIRKNRTPRTPREREYCWQVFRRLDDGTYTDTPMMAARTMPKAVDVIATLERVAWRSHNPIASRIGTL